MPDEDPLERYQKGLPVTAHNAQVQKDLQEQRKPIRKAFIALDRVDRDLNEQEAIDLRELLDSDGWKVVVRLLEKSSNIRKKSAIDKSQIDPLGNKDEIAKVWAYCALYDTLRYDMQEMIVAELAKADEKRKKD